VIDVSTLIVCGFSPTIARAWAPAVEASAARYEITSRVRIAAYLAEVGYESNYFTHTEENLYYTTPERIRALWPVRVPSLEDAAKLCRNPQALANTIYDNRLGNGDFSSGDGWRYRGRGPMQLTGKTNYKVAGDAIGVDYIANPELVSLPLDGARTSGWFWASIHGNELADNSDIDGLTKRINGGMAGAAERKSRFETNLRLLKGV
jgi:putative chitinase